MHKLICINWTAIISLFFYIYRNCSVLYLEGTLIVKTIPPWIIISNRLSWFFWLHPNLFSGWLLDYWTGFTSNLHSGHPIWNVKRSGWGKTQWGLTVFSRATGLIPSRVYHIRHLISSRLYQVEYIKLLLARKKVTWSDVFKEKFENKKKRLACRIINLFWSVLDRYTRGPTSSGKSRLDYRFFAKISLVPIIDTR